MEVILNGSEDGSQGEAQQEESVRSIADYDTARKEVLVNGAQEGSQGRAEVQAGLSSS